MTSPLFILGAPRSGTTLVRSLMGGFPSVYLPPDELQVLKPFLSQSRSGAEAADFLNATPFAGHMRRRGIWPTTDALVSILDGKTPSAALEALVAALAKAQGSETLKYWGDKTPENVSQLDLIFTTWPDAKIIHVIRDPRDTVFSMHKSWGRSFLRGSVIWRDAIRNVDACRLAGRDQQIFDIRYEALTKDTPATLAALAKWLDIPFDANFLNDFATEERWSNSRSSGVQNRGAQWMSQLSATQIKLIESICFNEMTVQGYEPSQATEPKNPSRFALKIAKLGDGLRVLRAYSKERGMFNALAYKLQQWTATRKGPRK